MESDFSLAQYAEYILDTPAILAPCNVHEWCYADETFGEIYSNEVMDEKAVEHALSMFFNDVRLKSYIEIRPADSMPIAYVMAYAAFLKGLFYSSDNLDAMDALFQGVNADHVEKAKEALMEKGYDAEVYGRPVSEIADELIELSFAGLTSADRLFLKPLADLVTRRKTLADMASTQLN
jgi:glutamate--cysteine ligase